MTAAVAGDVLTVTSSMSLALTPEGGRVYPRGTVLTVTEEWIESSRNRHGESYLDDLSPEAQTARWGSVKFVFGDQREEVQWWNGGDEGSLNYARQLDRERIAKIGDPDVAARELEASVAKFGRQITSRVLATYAPDAENTYAPKDVR